MSSAVSTITSKWQLTLPEGVRNEVPVKSGQRVVWHSRDGYWEVRPIRSLEELSGCLHSPGLKPVSIEAMQSAVRAARQKSIAAKFPKK